MVVIGTAVVGVALVLATILLARLHPLIALLLGSLFLLAATPNSTRIDTALGEKILTVVRIENASLEFDRDVPQDHADGQWVVLHSNIAESGPETTQSFAILPSPSQIEIPSTALYKLSSASGIQLTVGDRIVPLADWEAFAATSRFDGVGSKLADGFAKTFRRLGIPVTMAAIVGVCLLESGAAAKLVAAIMALFGPRGTAPSLSLSGFLLGVPVYFDSVFYLLLPLARAVGRQRPEAYLTAVMAIIVGATMAHSLVPPTPGPLLVASAMNVSVGMMMIGGFVVGGIAAIVGFAYGSQCKRWVHLRPDDLSSSNAVGIAQSTTIPISIAVLPVALPIVALGGSEVLEFFASQSESGSALQRLNTWLQIFNDPGLIFIGTAVLAIAILRFYASAERVGQAVAKGLSDAGTIVLLTCAGGAFGASLQQLGLANAIGQEFSGLSTPWGVLFTAFFLTTIIRAAQGSATVAMITSAAIVAPVAETIALPFHPLYIALAIGCGSKPLPWMNDSGFWQVASMTGMTANQTLRTFSVALTLMGITGFLVTLLGAWVLPLV